MGLTTIHSFVSYQFPVIVDTALGINSDRLYSLTEIYHTCFSKMKPIVFHTFWSLVIFPIAGGINLPHKVKLICLSYNFTFYDINAIHANFQFLC